ncbi:MAG: hypothetical protein Q4B48_00965 [Syntrophomonadaceae bacterium]|nr:hypothetical protein [Syntrophomonadaceae bacterium]
MAKGLKKGAVLWGLALLAVFMFMGIAPAAAAQNIAVTIPEFKTAINGEEFDNAGAQYPLVVYKDITYFPMTWSFCRELGLVSSWDAKRGLYIAVLNVALYGRDDSPVEAEATSINNRRGAKYPASIATYPIVLNGLPIDNSQEEYPLINFRDITYFPMTWRFAHDELGWELAWSDAEGFDVNSYRSIPTEFYVAELAEEYALLQKSVQLSWEQVNDDGSITYSTAGQELTDYKLDYRTNRLTYVGKSAESKFWQPSLGENISAQIECAGSDLLYNGTVIADISELVEQVAARPESADYSFEEGEHNAAIHAHSRRVGLDGVNVIEAQIYYMPWIPAPYTPYVYYVFVERDGVVIKIDDWDPANRLTGVYRNGAGELYLCSDYHSLGGRWHNNSGAILKVGAEGKTERLNDRYDDYNSLRALGMHDDKLYVLATWFPDVSSEYGGQVSAVNDGFFTLDRDGTLTKFHDFVSGETFMTPDGGLYCIMSWNAGLINLLSGERIYPVE